MNSLQGKPCIVPGTSDAIVPRSLRAIEVDKQESDDFACGLFATTTAARQLRTIGQHQKAKELLADLKPADRARIEGRLTRGGLFEKDVRALAAAASLGVYRPNTHDAAQFREPGWLWMALVLTRCTDPGTGETYVARHYVLVLKYLKAKSALVIADPYPGNPSVYCVDEAMFEAAWRAAKTKGPPWAAALWSAQR